MDKIWKFMIKKFEHCITSLGLASFYRRPTCCYRSCSIYAQWHLFIKLHLKLNKLKQLTLLWVCDIASSTQVKVSASLYNYIRFDYSLPHVIMLAYHFSTHQCTLWWICCHSAHRKQSTVTKKAYCMTCIVKLTAATD